MLSQLVSRHKLENVLNNKRLEDSGTKIKGRKEKGTKVQYRLRNIEQRVKGVMNMNELLGEIGPRCDTFILCLDIYTKYLFLKS